MEYLEELTLALKVVRNLTEKIKELESSSDPAGYVLPATIGKLVADSKVPRLWEKANGRKYNGSKDPCVNDLRRFALLVMHHSLAGKT